MNINGHWEPIPDGPHFGETYWVEDDEGTLTNEEKHHDECRRED